jgi:Ran-interacting Mog1 protein
MKWLVNSRVVRPSSVQRRRSALSHSAIFVQDLIISKIFYPTMAATFPLFGGALTCELPTIESPAFVANLLPGSSCWIDLSRIRQVSDHQECFMELNAGEESKSNDPGDADNSAVVRNGRVLVIEIMDPPTLDDGSKVSDDNIVSFYFHDLAAANAPSSRQGPISVFGGAASLERLNYPLHLPPDDTAQIEGEQAVRCMVGYGHHATDSKGGQGNEAWVRVDLAVIRLKNQVNSDILVSLTTPVPCQPPPPPSSPADAWAVPDPLFQHAVDTLQINDWNLFVNE